MNTSIWTRAELDEQIRIYKEALKKCASGASYSIGSRSLTRQDLPSIREHLAYLSGELAALEGRRGPVIVEGRLPLNVTTERATIKILQIVMMHHASV